MRFTLDLDDDIYAAVAARASTEGRSIGDQLSELARQALAAHSPNAQSLCGFEPFTGSGIRVTYDDIDRLREGRDI